MRVRNVVLVSFLAAALPCAASVHKCRAPDGTVTYQQLPCAGPQQQVGSDIPSEFPPPNLAERERILQREAELHRRLEAERDRLSAETVARLSRPEVVLVQAQAAPAILPLNAFPRWKPRPPSRDAYREWSGGRLR